MNKKTVTLESVWRWKCLECEEIQTEDSVKVEMDAEDRVMQPELEGAELIPEEVICTNCWSGFDTSVDD